ncbi:hypothetical protein ACTFIY_005670 [Dictyostelium cf. discoideum]
MENNNKNNNNNKQNVKNRNNLKIKFKDNFCNDSSEVEQQLPSSNLSSPTSHIQGNKLYFNFDDNISNNVSNNFNYNFINKNNNIFYNNNNNNNNNNNKNDNSNYYFFNSENILKNNLQQIEIRNSCHHLNQSFNKIDFQNNNQSDNQSDCQSDNQSDNQSEIQNNKYGNESVVPPKVKKTRSRKTKEHKDQLENLFNLNPFPDAIEKEIIAYQFDMSVEQIVTWFKHKRENLKKAQHLEYKQNSTKKFTKTTKELYVYFENYPFPQEERVEYFAKSYHTSNEKILNWFSKKRYSLRKTHSFIYDKGCGLYKYENSNFNFCSHFPEKKFDINFINN